MGLVHSLLSEARSVLSNITVPRFQPFRVDFGDRNEYAVFISGCDTGFGNLLAKRMAQEGFRVYANCLTEEGAARLREEACGRVTVLVGDITDKGVVEGMYVQVERECAGRGGLYALINNAGIGVGAPIDLTSMEVYQRTMDVNFFAHVHVTKTFLPLLETACRRPIKPRVINVTSVAGLLGVPGLSAYCSSKYALEAFNDCLRRECYTLGMKSIAIEPGFMSTPIVMQSMQKVEALWVSLTPEKREKYGEEWHKARLAETEKIMANASPPSLVIDAVYDAITSTYPRERYLVKPPPIIFFQSLLPTAVVDWLIYKDNSKVTPPLFVKRLLEAEKQEVEFHDQV